MPSSKKFSLLLVALFALMLLISTEVTASTDQATKNVKGHGVGRKVLPSDDLPKPYPGSQCSYGCCDGKNLPAGLCTSCCYSRQEAP